jgi:DNA excision repair protein ERCC-1
MPPKVISNPYAKRRKLAAGDPPSSSLGEGRSVNSQFSRGNDISNNKYSNNAASSSNSTMGGNNGGAKFHANGAAAGDALLPSNYAMIPGSFSQAFTSIDATEDFRRASESFETEIRDNNKRESFRLARVKKGRKAKPKSIFETQTSESTKDEKSNKMKPNTFSSALSNRDGGGLAKQQDQQQLDGEKGDSKQQPQQQQKGFSSNEDEITGDTKGDVRIHHTMLQPHVLYVSTRQKGNAILPLIRNVPIAYSPMVPDYILGPTSCALFLSIKYHKLYPRYILRRIAELRKDFKLRVLLVFVDVDDNANTILQLNTIGVTNQLTVILCWSELEAARYLETYKTRDGKDATPIQKKESTNPLDRVTDFLTGGRAGVNKTDAMTLWNQFSTVAGIAAASRDELALVGGMGPVKVRRLHEALHKPFSKLRSRARKKQRLQQTEEDEADNATEENTTRETAEANNK